MTNVLSEQESASESSQSASESSQSAGESSQSTLLYRVESPPLPPLSGLAKSGK